MNQQESTEFEAEQSPAKESSTKLIMPGAEEIRPSRPIPQKDIDEIKAKHVRLAHTVLTAALEIGFKLRSWQDLIPRGRWLKWCAINLPTISERSIQVYLKLWENSDLIKAKIQNRSAADLTEPAELPSIREALGWIASHAPISRTKEKQARPASRQSDIKATVVRSSVKERHRSKLVDAETGEVLNEDESVQLPIQGESVCPPDNTTDEDRTLIPSEPLNEPEAQAHLRQFNELMSHLSDAALFAHSIGTDKETFLEYAGSSYEDIASYEKNL